MMARLTGKIPYAELYGGLVEKADGCGLESGQYGEVSWEGVAYPLLRLSSPSALEQERILVITSGFHGNEIAGPLSLHEHLEKIAAYAARKDVGLVIFPCVNPTGYEFGTRYNMAGQAGNNDFLRYRKDGALVDDLKSGTEHQGWYWASDPSLCITLPEETAILHSEMRRLPFERVLGLVDLHQDYFLTEPGTYTYVFGSGEAYAPIAERVGKTIPVLRSQAINSGQPDCRPEDVPVSDSHGFIRRHDCTINDLFYRQGVQYCITVETTGAVKLGTAMGANLTWVKGIIGLVASHRK